VRSFSLPASVKVDKVAASFERGVLTVRLPKVASARPRHVKVSLSSTV
jgi:HSP20 family molecular chaperone IbpA